MRIDGQVALLSGTATTRLLAHQITTNPFPEETTTRLARALRQQPR